MPDIFSYELVEALPLAGCPLCRVLEVDDVRWMDGFWREAKTEPRLRQAFFDAGGFCRSHAWLLHERVSKESAGAAIAEIYGALAARDLAWLAEVEEELETRRSRKLPDLRRNGSCPACRSRAADLERKLSFLAQVLAEEAAVRDRYEKSEGLCFTHLAAAVRSAAKPHREAALFLLANWQRRLAEVRDQLADFDRQRDYRYADEPKGAEQTSWTDVISLYGGPRLRREGR